MKKLVSKVVAGLLLSSCCIGAFAGCNKSETANSSSSGKKPVEKFEPTVYASNGEDIADYTIVISQSADKSTSYGATILQTRIKQATGAELPIVTDATV